MSYNLFLSPLFHKDKNMNDYISEINLENIIYCHTTITSFAKFIFYMWIIGSYTSPYWRSGISSTSVRNSVFSRVERIGTSGKTLNFSHEWKKSQIFNKDECKYLFLPFQLKNKACRLYSFIRMSMSCLLHKILKRDLQCSKYTLI